MIINDLKYSLNDVAIVPDVQTNVEHRASCDPYYSDNMLPLFTAPMTSVVGTDNYMEFIKNGITPILPRTISLGKRLEFMNKGVWISMSLDEFIIYFLKNPESVDLTMKKVVIDIANGHMKKLTNTVNEAKTKHGKHLTIMAGNIANPETYKELSMAGADYIRIGIGNGYGCLTSTNVGINYPMASLIDECHEIKKCYNGSKIIADGGFKGYADIIKGLALGADYIMCGSIFGKMMESSSALKIHEYQGCLSNGKLVSYQEGSEVNDYEEAKLLLEINAPLYKDFYGMSTKAVQKMMGSQVLKTSEGVIRQLPVEYTMKQWTDNFKDYLTSAMSYTNSFTLEQFKNETQLVKITYNSFNSFNK